MRPALGKGLDALMSDDAVANIAATAGKDTAVTHLSVDLIRPNPKQPRRNFSEESLADLVSSIQQKGILQPIVVSPTEGGTYEIIAGERRFPAAPRARLKEVAIVIPAGREEEPFEMS